MNDIIVFCQYIVTLLAGSKFVLSWATSERNPAILCAVAAIGARDTTDRY
jgi:hypothetical protein